MNIRANDFNISYIWEDPGGVTTPELAETWVKESFQDIEEACPKTITGLY